MQLGLNCDDVCLMLIQRIAPVVYVLSYTQRRCSICGLVCACIYNSCVQISVKCALLMLCKQSTRIYTKGCSTSINFIACQNTNQLLLKKFTKTAFMTLK